MVKGNSSSLLSVSTAEMLSVKVDSNCDFFTWIHLACKLVCAPCALEAEKFRLIPKALALNSLMSDLEFIDWFVSVLRRHVTYSGIVVGSGVIP